MIPNIQIMGTPDTHPEKPVHDAYELASGKLDFSKLKVKNHFVRVFDLMDSEQVNAYETLYVQLADQAKQGKIIVSCNTRETLTRSDGSTGWFKFVEWTEFDTSDILGA